MLEDSRSLLMEVVSGRREELGPRNPLTLHSISTLSQVLQYAVEFDSLCVSNLASSNTSKPLTSRALRPRKEVLSRLKTTFC